MSKRRKPVADSGGWEPNPCEFPFSGLALEDLYWSSDHQKARPSRRSPAKTKKKGGRHVQKNPRPKK